VRGSGDAHLKRLPTVPRCTYAKVVPVANFSSPTWQLNLKVRQRSLGTQTEP
jgi:hypothetical protein